MTQDVVLSSSDNQRRGQPQPAMASSEDVQHVHEASAALDVLRGAEPLRLAGRQRAARDIHPAAVSAALPARAARVIGLALLPGAIASVVLRTAAPVPCAPR